MPNTPGLIGEGVSAFCLGAGAGDLQAALARQALGPLGAVVQVREDQMDAVTALSGSGPAYVFLFMEALQAAGEALGLEPAVAFDLAAQTLVGASAMIAQRAAVTSPGGTTAAALKAFDDAGFRALVQTALTAARDRGAELGKA
jgi:pyrroline-5-carboxylate reductase